MNASDSAGSIMSQALLTVRPSDSVLIAYEVATHAGIHHLPVVSTDGHCLGLVSLDRLREFCLGPLGHHRPPVGDLAERRTPSVRVETSIRETAALMDAYDVDAVVVVNGHDRLIGLVTSRDIIRYAAGIPVQRHGEPDAHPMMFTLDPVTR